MKRLSTLIIAGFAAFSSVQAQAPADQRATSTRIADVLQQMPAPNSTKFNASMKEIAALGESGIKEMVSMLSPEGKGDNTNLQYAIGGYSAYVMQSGKEQERNIAVRAYAATLPLLANNELRDFLIDQLRLIGNNDAVPVLTTYLKTERLTDPAARALVVINTPDAQKALADALGSADGKAKITIIEALGDSRNKTAAPNIQPTATSADQPLRKASLYALANIGDERSASILREQASKSGYTFDVTNATSSYLLYIKTLAANGNAALAANLASELWKSAKTVYTRTAALKLLSDIQPDKSVSLLTAAATDKDAQYRAAALKFAAANTSDAAIAQWTKAYAKAGSDAKAGILGLLGASQHKAALPVIIAAIKDKDVKVKLAAIKAAGLSTDGSTVPALLDVIKKGDSSTVEAAQNALMVIKGEQLAAQVAAAIPQASPAAQTALVQVLAARKANNEAAAVWPLLKSNNGTVSKAAFEALPAIADKDQLPQLLNLLPVADAEALPHVQSAIIAALSSTSQADAINIVQTEMKKAPADKQSRYFKVLSGIGGNGALITIKDAFAKSTDVNAKVAAMAALANWKDASAASSLLNIAKENKDYTDAALTSYAKMVGSSAYTADQKFLLLRDGMEVATTNAQQAAILKEIEKCKVFPALVFAGKYLDKEGVQQAAASAVASIALSNKNFNGAEVRSLLEKVLKVLKGQDSDYQKEAIRKHLSEMPAGEGLVAIFNGKDLSGWKGLVANPVARGKMDTKQLAAAQKKADSAMLKGWSVKDGLLVFNGHGDNLCTVKKYGDFEMYVDWKITPEGDAGIYLRGTPQVQIWDTSSVSVGAQVGSGGLYNNQKNPSKPLVVADNAIGEWNNFHIIMKGDRVTVYLNGVLVTDNVILENYWDRGLPIFPEEQLELQAHGTYVAYRDIYVREIPRPKPFTLSEQEKKEGFRVLFDGTNMHSWTGNTTDYVMEDGDMVIYPSNGGKGNLYTKDEFSDFVYRFEFQLTPGANNGLGIRTPLEGDAAYVGMELQILDNDADIYKNLQIYQYHGSVYGIIPAKRGALKPMGEWNYQEVVAQGNKIKITLNGTVILDGDIAEASKNNTATADHKPHPGLLNKKGHIGYLGHGAVVRFRNIRVKELKSK